MSEMRSCSATDRQIGSDVSCKSSETTKVFWKRKRKKVYFVPISRRCSNVRPPTSINSRQRRSGDWRVCSKMSGCCLMVAAASTIRAIRSSSESTGDVPIGVVMWPHRKKFNSEVRWFGRPSHWPAPSNPASIVNGVPLCAFVACFRVNFLSFLPYLRLCCMLSS